MNECDDCGASVDARWKFCLNCGARMRVHAVTTTGFATAPEPYVPAPPVPATTSQFQPASAYDGGQQFASEPYYAPQSSSLPESRLDDEDEPDGSSTGGHLGRHSFRFDWQLALGVLLALGGIAMIVYLVVVLIVPHA
jgi:hypothetical protein